MPSTVIRRFIYSPHSEELTIEFVTGRRYVYSAVPEEEVQAMRETFSKGVYFNKHIRDRYAYRELV
jgi:lysyl-tRNA synthetase class 2